MALEEHAQSQLLLLLLLVLVAALLLLHGQRRRRNRKELRLPPGPRGLPVLGNLFLFTTSKRWHADFYKLAETYGPLMWLRLGSQGAVVVQSPELAAEILKHQDATFASRPPPSAGVGLIMYDCKDVAFAPYGAHWRFVRKLMTMELLTHKRINDFEHVRVEEVRRMVEAIGGHVGQPVDLGYLLRTFSLNTITRMGLGKAAISHYRVQDPQEAGKGNVESGDHGLVHHVREGVRFLGVEGIGLGDAVPWLSFLDFFVFPRAQLEQTHRQLDAFFSRVIQEHRQHRASHPGSPPRDFVDVLLGADVDVDGESSSITDHVISAQLCDTIFAGTDTTSATAEWAMAELLRHPDDMDKAVQELDRVVGDGRAVAEADVAHLPFLQAVVKETMRMYPAVPLLVPHYSTQDATVAGYHIPANTTVFVNAWGLGRDPAYWPHPHRFRPQRFLEADVDVRGRNFELLPFGAGRRMCPGATLALASLHLSLASLLHTFRWSLPADVARPEDLDMTERQGVAMHKALSLKAVPRHPKPRQNEAC